MPELTTQQHFRAVRRLPFCYLCGQLIVPRNDSTRDHVPPKGIFAKLDREPPLVLPSHANCNHFLAEQDEVVKSLLGLLRNEMPLPRSRHFKVAVAKCSNASTPLVGVHGVDLRFAMIRWVKGFHAALYREYLPGPGHTIFAVHPPLPEGYEQDGTIVLDQILRQQPLFVEVIKKNRVAKKLDRIECYNGKCIYECVWEPMDNGADACFFALNIYNWKDLADGKNFPVRGGMGWYQPPHGRPKLGTNGVAKLLWFPFDNAEPLDPFGK